METIFGFPHPPDANVERGAQLLTVADFLEAAHGSERPLLDPLPFTGHEETLAALVDFASTPGSARIAVLPGRAGMGKTSLLAELASALVMQRVGASMRFVVDATPGGTPGAQRLPPGRCLLVIDDAHQKAAFSALLPMIVDRPEDVRVVLTTRPAGLMRLRSLFAQAGFEANEVRVLPELGALPPEQAEALARGALGEERGDLAARLAAAAEGTPFTIALGARLLRDEALHPVALDQPGDFACRAFDRGLDFLLLRAGSAMDPKLLSGVLALVAALAPARVGDERFLQGAGEILSCRRRDLVSALRVLEGAGLLERGAHGSRIVPGAFADHALQRALVGPAPFTGTVEERARSFATNLGIQSLVPLICNARMLDGPSVPSGRARELVDELFRHVRAELETASAPDRSRMLGAMRDLAGGEPAAILELVEAAMRNPGRADGNAPAGALFSQASVLYELPAILRRIGHHLEHLPRVCDLLWELGRDDLRLQSPHPDHPVRVLRDLASRMKARPVGVHEALLDAAVRWLQAPDAHDHKHSPLDVLDTFLADSASDGEGDARRRTLRDRALAALFGCARASDRRAALAGVGGLERVLSDTMGSLFSELEEPPWRDIERHDILRMLREAAEASTDALVHFAVADALGRVARRSACEELREAAEEALVALPASYERRLYEALTLRAPAQRGSNAPPMSERYPGAGGDGVQQSMERYATETCKAVAVAMLARHPSPEGAAEALGAALEALGLAGKAGSPRLLLHVLSRKHPTEAAGICEAIMRNPESPLGPHIASLLHGLRIEDPPRASALIAAIVADGNPTLCASIAQVFHRWVEKPIEGDHDALRKLLAHRDGFVRRAALGTLRTLARSSPRDAVDLAVGIDLSEGPEIAEALFGALDAGSLLTGEALSEEEIILFLSRLRGAQSFDGHSTMRFLHHAGKRLPDEVAELMVDRVAQTSAREGAGDYEPLPSEGLSSILAGLSSSPSFLPVLRRIRQLARGRGGWVRFHAARLFHDASRSFSLPSVEVLAEWVDGGGPEELEAIAALLEEAPAAFLFAHLDLVSSLLERAHAAGDAYFERVRGALFSVATGQARPRTGRPILGETALREQSREAAARLPRHSPAQRFFESLAKHAEAALVEEDIGHDDELFDV
ncbi:hypothetical protein [Polyangium aurulentum]|uniref:hypothetical protein n=1 Tax=Polyangium aurulentum TaxID=2567896 RepID=UPI0010AE4603|nr:hypothetical protein [Polyangium aurulentum]UQA60130.1 hypothetical protein E8A73_006500 [Polyangium aurulentum]